MKRMEKVTQKATQINDNAQLSEKEKIAAIRSLFAKVKDKTKHEVLTANMRVFPKCERSHICIM